MFPLCSSVLGCGSKKSVRVSHPPTNDNKNNNSNNKNNNNSDSSTETHSHRKLSATINGSIVDIPHSRIDNSLSSQSSNNNNTSTNSNNSSSNSNKNKDSDIKNTNYNNSQLRDRRNEAAISIRAHSVLSTPSVTIKYNQKVGADLFNSKTNPQGFVDLGLAENKLCQDLITEKMKSYPDDLPSEELRYYPDVRGLPRNSLKSFIEREFKAIEPLNVDNVMVACGLTALLDAVAFALAEDGDYIMTSSPYYYRIKNDLSERAGVRVLEVPLVGKPRSKYVKPYTLDVDVMENAYLRARREGKCVKAVLLVNPNNPLGDVYSAQQILQVLDFGARYQLHVIVDEIYAMSIFDSVQPFVSVLSLPHPDPERVHFLWGFSKDFGLSGYRCGVLYTRNDHLVKYLVSLGLYQQTAPLVQNRLKHLIDDIDWLHNIYMPTLKDRLRKHYRKFTDALRECGVGVHHCGGGIFIWMDASGYLPEKSFAGEHWLFERFMEEKVFILPGRACYSREPGYFRIVFSLEEDVCDEGIKRIQAVFRKLQAPEKQSTTA